MLNADQLTRSITGDFVERLHRDTRSPTTISRVLGTLCRCPRWVDRQAPFLAGNPTERVPDLNVDGPQCKTLRDMENNRLKAAAEQLVHLRRRQNQHPPRDRMFLRLRSCPSCFHLT